MDLAAAQSIIGVLLIAALAILAVKSSAIDVSGAIVGVLITFSTLVAGGLRWLIVIAAFFVISSLFTRFRFDYKQAIGSAQEKGGKRSWPNTVANGLVASIAALAEIYTHQEIFAVAFLGSVAVAMSDTLATEVGLLSNSRPRAITNLKRFVTPGTSGGVSLLGELAALGSSVGIALLALMVGAIPLNTGSAAYVFFGVIIGGMIGTNFDSLLGATVEGMRRCIVCGTLTENLSHHDNGTVIVHGSRFIDNNVVNIVAISTGTMIALLIFLLI